MSRWPGRLITKTPIAPSGSSAFDSAPGVWTLPEVAYWTKQGLWPNAANVGDPYFKYVSYLLGTTATNAAQNNTFVDSSTNNFTITRNGNATQGTFSPYAARWSNYFDGSGDYLTTPSNAAFAYGTGDFTWEMWVFPTAANWTTTGNYYLMDHGSNGGTFSYYQNVIRYYNPTTGTGSALYTNGGTIPVNQWTHVAVSRSGGTTSLFVNGALRTSASDSYNYGTAAVTLANYGSGGIEFQGYISNARIVKGTAVYTSAFTPPAAPLTAVSGTSLLTCQSNRFRDASTNNFAITANGNTSITAFNPFGQPAPGYSTSTYGGSAYFDGNGDFLSLAGSSAFSIATSSTPFTIECWIYPTAAGGCIFSEQWTGGGNVAISLLMADVTGTETNGQYISLGYYNGAWGNVKANTQVPLNAWTHVAAVFNGAASKIFYNGVDVTAASPVTSWATAGTSGDAWYIGKRWDTPSGYVSFFSGYISGFRFVNGTAVYTSAFTPPTAPPTAVTNTSLLCNFTNAGIFDASMNSDMETVGNAQVTTAVSKYGGSSVSFDGNGDYLVSVGGLPFSFGTGDFTIELWAYYNSIGADQVLIDCRSTGGVLQAWALNVKTGGVVDFIYSGSARLQTSGLISTGAWYHIAVTRASGTMRIFVNGTQAASVSYSSAIDSSTTTPNIGRGIDPVYTNGYIDDLRITKGYARYTTNFTPPSSAFFAF